MSKYSEVDMRDNTTGRVDAMQGEIAELRARLREVRADWEQGGTA